jgi:hypothetical protein
MSTSPPVSGYVGWYKGDGWTPSGWTNAASPGTNNITTVSGAISTGFDCCSGQPFVRGDATTSMTLPFAWSTSSPYTFFHVARYDGPNRGRIFTANVNVKNWLSGYCDARVGVAYHEGWLTQIVQNAFDPQMWLVSSDRPTNYRGNGINKTIYSVAACAPDVIMINCSVQQSCWAVAEMIVYNSTLSDADVQAVEDYLMAKHFRRAVPRIAAPISIVGNVFRKLYDRTTDPQTGLSALYRDNGIVTTNVTSVPAYGEGPIALSHGRGLYGTSLLFRYSAESLAQYRGVDSVVTTWYDDLNIFNAATNNCLRYDSTYRYFYFELDGSNYITVPTLNLKYRNHANEAIQGFTCIVVAKFNDTANWGRLFDFGKGTPNDTLLFARYGSTNKLSLQAFNGGTFVASAEAENAVDLDLHIYTAVVDNVAMTMKIYRDGALLASTTYTTPLTDRVMNGGNYIGRSNWYMYNDQNLNARMATFDWHTLPLNDRELMQQHVTYMERYKQALPLVPGLVFRTFGSYFYDAPSFFDTTTASFTGTTTQISNLYTGTKGQMGVNTYWAFSVEWFGYFRASVTGTWTFYVASDDAGYMWLGASALSGYTTANALINNGSVHGVIEVANTVSLTAGTYYPIRIQTGSWGGPSDCQVSFTPPGGARTYEGTGHYFAGTGFNQSYPGLNAQGIKACTGTVTNGNYWILSGGVATSTYCVMA